MPSIKFTLFFFVSLLAICMAQQKPNNTVRPSASDKVTAKSARSDYHHGHHGIGGGYEHHYPHHFGGGHLGGHYKEFDHYLMPLLVVLGLGVLVMPLISVLMTTLVGNVPVTTLVSGRKRRDLGSQFGQVTEDKVVDLLKRFGKAYEAFNKKDT